MDNKKVRKIIRTKEGIVTSNKMDKTVIVVCETFKAHRVYKKRFKVTKKYKAHDDKNECNVGDKVLIRECRPLSREKKWRIVKIIK